MHRLGIKFKFQWKDSDCYQSQPHRHGAGYPTLHCRHKARQSPSSFLAKYIQVIGLVCVFAVTQVHQSCYVL